MRGIGRQLVRLPAATALIAGAALLTGAGPWEAFAQAGSTGPLSTGEDTALAIPRIAAPGGAGVALPQPLPPSEAAKIRRIFALQSRGDIPAALRETSQVDMATPLGAAMLGHILAQRFLGAFTRPSADQLRDWLDRWPDLPDARAILALLVVRLPAGEKAPPLPPGFTAAAEDEPLAPVPEETEPEANALRRNPSLDRSVWEAARARGSAGVARLLAGTKGLAPSYAAQLRGEAAQILFTLNRDDEAFELARVGVYACQAAGANPCARAAIAGYSAGLAAWRQGNFDAAGAMFAAAWHADITTPSLKAGAAYWAARVRLRDDDRAGAAVWLQRAAAQRSTFYGLLARRTLELPLGISRVGPGEQETLGEADIEAVAATPAGMRAFALLQVDQPERAAAELRSLWTEARQFRPLARALMLVAEQGGLADLAMQYADMLAAADGRPRESMRFPIPHLRPTGGFRMDPAMMYGLARTESNFDADLVSSAGARGLLQIMPDTASFIVGTSISREFSSLLRDPAINLDLGQRYVAYLAGHEAVNGDLIRLLAAYNAGPTNFTRWSQQIRDNGDPLLFIEAIPLDETRAHVPRVLTYTWIYAALMHLPAPSLDELAAGLWPRYHPYDDPHASPARLH
jgi:soluble lytic murein transglycosylase